MSAAENEVADDAQQAAAKPAQKIYFVIEGQSEGKSDFWQECGAAWENKKGGFNLVLPGMKLVMLPNKAKK